ncbi:hypothetical protein ANN_28098 [Periplaneta americana]|uniref:Transposase Tc1-like domain-containing protein n=1 Tax=Periplaneta americana TaxID=6978 RepID=A0ABQ8RUZ3_PERAM|nr:hypothetical protein ANN_28098 [Periplaneta americana]
MPVQGRPWVTTPQEDRYLTLTARRNRTMPARQLSSELAAASGVGVSRQTVYRRLRAGGLCARRPAVCVQLTRVHIRNRLYWYCECPEVQRRGIATNVRLFRGAVCPQFIFMDDNARPHRVNLVDEYHEGEYIRRMDWPAMSPDLNSIEHTWDALGRRVATHQPPSRTLSTLRNALHQEWKQLSAELLNHVIEGMPRRCDVCVALRGNYTPY